MTNSNRNEWYAPLLPQFPMTEDAMSLSRFAEVEAVLYLLSLSEPNADPTKAYLLFAQYQLIGTTECTAMEHTLRRARYTLGYYRSQKYWQDALREYREYRYDAFRAFSFEESNGGISFFKAEDTYPHPYLERKKEWERFWPEHIENLSEPSYAGVGAYKYVYQDPEDGEEGTVNVRLDNDYNPNVQPDISEKGCRSPISISLKELLETAKEMSEICSDDPCYTILETNILKQIDNSSVQPCAELTICEVVNIVGMVGAGKSTLIKVLSFWCHKNGYRIAVVVDTVAEVLNMQKYLSALGVSCSPLIGRMERLKYINQVTQPNETCLPGEFSQYLTPVALLMGWTPSTVGQSPLEKNLVTFCKRARRIICAPILMIVQAQRCCGSAIPQLLWLRLSRVLRHRVWVNGEKLF